MGGCNTGASRALTHSTGTEKKIDFTSEVLPSRVATHVARQLDITADATLLDKEPSGSFPLKIYLGLAALAILRFWIAPLRTSLWLDETASFWTACKGIAETFHRVQHAPGQSLAYSLLLALVMRVGGQNELVLRLPSLLAGLGTAWLLFVLGKRLMDREAGMLAVIVFLSLPEVWPEIPNARPYAIALFFVVASVLELVRWLDTGSIRHMLAYVALSAAIMYFHPLLPGVYSAHVVYALVRVRGNSRVRWPNVFLAAVLMFAAVVPLLWYVFRVQRMSANLSWAGTPNAGTLVGAVLPQTLAASVFMGLLVSYLLWRRIEIKASSSVCFEDFILLLSWLTLPLICAFMVSRFSPFKIFFPRYYLGIFPAMALFAAWGLRSIFPVKARVLVATLVVLTVLAANGLRAYPYNHQDWRAAADAVRASGITANTPLLIRSGLIETANIKSGYDVSVDSLMLCPISKYPMPGKIMLAPYQMNSDGIRYMEHVYSDFLEPAQEFLVVGRKDPEFMAWFTGHFGDRFVARVLTRNDNQITVTEFRRP